MDKLDTTDYDDFTYIMVSPETKQQMDDRAAAKEYKKFLASMTYCKRRKYLAQQKAKQKRLNL